METALQTFYIVGAIVLLAMVLLVLPTLIENERERREKARRGK